MACLILTSRKKQTCCVCAENSLSVDIDLALSAQYAWYIMSLKYSLKKATRSQRK